LGETIFPKEKVGPEKNIPWREDGLRRKCVPKDAQWGEKVGPNE